MKWRTAGSPHYSGGGGKLVLIQSDLYTFPASWKTKFFLALNELEWENTTWIWFGLELQQPDNYKGSEWVTDDEMGNAKVAFYCILQQLWC